MKTLFAKILAWFVATIFITSTGSWLIAQFSDSPTSGRRSWEQTARAFMVEAQHIYDVDGPKGVSAYFRRIETGFGGRVIAVDDQGRDLVAGSDRSQLVARAKDTVYPLVREGSEYFIPVSDAAGHWLFLQVPFEFRLLTLLQLSVIAMVIVLCYFLARHLTAPLRGLQDAANRFGRGDLTARWQSRRRDELGQLARTFNQMAERIQLLLENQRNFLHDISHELRSPLTRLGLAVELARSDWNKDQTLDRIEIETQRLNMLVGELLSLTRIEHQRSALHRSPVRLDHMLEELVDVCSLEAAKRKCRIVLRSDKPIAVEADEELLRRAVENILRNALRYAPENTDVILTIANSEARTRITVRDGGPGVPAESLDRIFEPFYRVDQHRNRETGGVGLGLAIARRAIEAHGGDIHARNANPGLEVEIRLPCMTQPV